MILDRKDLPDDMEWALEPPGGRGGRSNIGSAHELFVASALIHEGYYVYRAVGHHGPFDLVAYKDHALSRIEVRGVGRNQDGTLIRSMTRRDECDVYAFVSEGEIILQGAAQMPVPWQRTNKGHPDWEQYRVSNGQVAHAS